MAEQRRALQWVGLLATTLLLGACIEDPHVTLDKDLNVVRLRSVKISASACRERGPNEKSKKCDAISHHDLMRVSQMRGIIGAPLKAVAGDNDTDAAYNYRYGLYGYWARIPTGYGCKAMLQGIFPSPSKVKACSDADGCSAKTGAAGQQCVGQCVTKHSDPDKIDNYELGPLESLIGGVDNALSSIIWTAGYNIGDGLGTCTYGVGGKGGSPSFKYAGKAVPEHLGTPIEDPAKWAKVVRKVTRWYNRELPTLANKTDPSCKIATPTAANPRSWRCDPSLFNIEFGRDPNGAGGFTNSTKTKWKEAYRQFAKELRAEFPFPKNQASTPVNLMAPSVVVDESILAPTAKSWLFDFVDFAAT
jgi:hypothetical protein